MVFLSMFYKYSCAAHAFSKVLTPAISSPPLQPVAFSYRAVNDVDALKSEPLHCALQGTRPQPAFQIHL
jgi:hypothetical protein